LPPFFARRTRARLWSRATSARTRFRSPRVREQRVYTAHVVQSGATLNVALTGANFLRGSNSFSGVVVSANEIRFEIIVTRQGQRGTFAIVFQGDVQHGLWQR
jgi:hypothetical protein